MTVRGLGIVLSVVALTGCASVQTVERKGGIEAYREVNQAVRGKVAHVKLVDGTEMNAVGVRVDADSLSWLDRQTNRLDSVPTRDVREVSIVKAGSGALRGLLFGVIAGAAVGGVRAAVEGDDPGDDPLAATQSEKYRIYPPAHAVYASLATTPLGAIVGKRRVFQFESGQVTAER